MLTKCPECDTVFRVTDEQLNAAAGRVRCGECMAVFRATDHAVEETAPPQAPESTAPAPPEAAAPTLEHDGVDIETLLKAPDTPSDDDAPADIDPVDLDLGASADDMNSSEPEPTPPPTEPVSPPPPKPAVDPAPAAAPQPPVDDLPESLQPAKRNSGGGWAGLFGWGLLSLLLLALLGGQYAYFERQRLAQEPQLRPWLSQMCELLRCELPLRRDLGALELLSRNIRSHERLENVLVISATIANRAAFAQPYPDVEVTLRNLRGDVVANRRFSPQEYLDEDSPGPFAPESKAQLHLEVQDPGREAMSFAFDFH